MNYCRAFPSPNFQKMSEGKLYINGLIKINTKKLNNTAKKIYSEMWSNFSANISNLDFDENISNENIMTIGNPDISKINKDYDHYIVVDENGVILYGKDKKNLGYAFSYLTQLFVLEGELKVEKCYLFCGEYGCKCDNAFRGIHGYIGHKETYEGLRQKVLTAAYLKYSHYIFEFFGMFQFDCFPEFAFDGAFSKSQIKTLAEEANALGLEIIPMFNCCGHASCGSEGKGEHVLLGKHPEYATLFEPDTWTWCLSNPATIKLLKSFREEILEVCGEGTYFHMGMDECRGICSCPICMEKDQGELFVSYVNSVAKEMKQKGRKLVIWGDELLYSDDFPSPFSANSLKGGYPFHHDIAHSIDKLDKDIIICDWQYQITEGENLTTKYFMNKGFTVWQTAWKNYPNLKWQIETAKKYGNGVLQTYWGEDLYAAWNYIMAAQIFFTGRQKVPSTANTFCALARRISPQIGEKGYYNWLCQN